MLNCFYTFYFEMFFNEKKKNSNVSMKRYAEIGSSWQAPLSRLKYWVVLPPFITQESWSFNKISVHVIKLLPNPHFRKTELAKSWSRESKAFSISIVTRNPSLNTNHWFQWCQTLIYHFLQQICFLHKQFVLGKLTLAKQLLIFLK